MQYLYTVGLVGFGLFVGYGFAERAVAFVVVRVPRLAPETGHRATEFKIAAALKIATAVGLGLSVSTCLWLGRRLLHMPLDGFAVAYPGLCAAAAVAVLRVAHRGHRRTIFGIAGAIAALTACASLTF